MKKITLSLFVLICSFAVYGQENLLSNGDFEQGMVTWFGNAFNVVEDGGNNFNQSDNEVATNPFDVNLSHPVAITQGVTYTLTYEASTSVEDASRTVISGIGLNEGDFAANVETITITSDTQTITQTFTATFGSANSRVIFDLGADDGILVLDNVVLTAEETTTGGDELLSNGDFEQGMVTWFGNAFNVVEDGGNNFNQSDNEVATNPFDVNLSHPVALTAGETYVFSFDASTSAEDMSRTVIAGIGLNEGDFAAVTEVVTVTSDTQTFTYTFTPTFGSANSRALFDLGADDGILVLDNVSLMLVEDEEMTMPMTAAPTPPERDEESVFSLFSDAYTQQPNTVFGAFDVGTQDIETIQIEEDNTLQLGFNQPAAEFLLVDWGEPLDLSGLTHFHMDYWIDTNLSAGLIANPKWSNHVGDAGETSAFQLTNPVSTFGEWVSIDVPLTDFVDGDASQQRDALRQFVLTLAGAEGGDRTLFIDNLYLHDNTTLSTDDFTSVSMNVFPNPATNRWTITTNSQVSEVMVYDILGKRVMTVSPNTASVNLDATILPQGIYIAKVITPEGTQSLKLLKQ